MSNLPFKSIIRDETALREILPAPGQVSVLKVIDHIDQHARSFLQLSPFLVMATAGEGGSCDSSPRGGKPGFVQVVDDQHLFIPESTGNRRADTIVNIIRNPNVGLFIMIPGLDDTLRINGEAFIFSDPAYLDGIDDNGKKPVLGIGVRVQQCFLHCAKAFMRSNLWNPITWPDLNDFKDAAEMMRDHTVGRVGDGSVRSMKEMFEESYTKRL